MLKSVQLAKTPALFTILTNLVIKHPQFVIKIQFVQDLLAQLDAKHKKIVRVGKCALRTNAKIE